MHETATGEKILVIHGDEFDAVVRYAKWLAFLGDWAYAIALTTNTYFNLVRRKLGFPYWSLSAWLKLRVKNAVNFIGEFENALAAEADRSNVSGIICGHIHHPAIRDMNGLKYMNCGDWVESCTAIVENMDGSFEVVHWPALASEQAQQAERLRLAGTEQAAA